MAEKSNFYYNQKLHKESENPMSIKTIGIAAPAGVFDVPRFKRGLAVLRDLGYELFVDDRIYASDGYLAGPDHLRAAVLRDVFANDAVDAVMCARGGYGCARLLPLLDWQAIATANKPLIGFSDCTALFGGLYAAGGKHCWHGPVVSQMEDLGEESLRAFVLALEQGGKMMYMAEDANCLRAGKARAPLFGGNLAVLCSLAGTPYFPDMRGHILFLEDLNEDLYKIDRMLTQLKLAGVLDTAAGVVLGEFVDCGDAKAIDRRLLELLEYRDIPVLSGFPAGHSANNHLLPLGMSCFLNAQVKSLTFTGV